MDERLDDIINSEIMDIETSMNILINAVQLQFCIVWPMVSAHETN